MAYRNPRYAHLHALRDVGVGSITPNATFVAGDDKYLIDDRMTAPFAWSDSAAGHLIDTDLGAGVTGIDRLFIPFGHNLNGGKILIQDDEAADFVGAATLHAAETIASAAAIDIDVFDTGNQTQRYLRVSHPDNAGAWSYGQLWLTTTLITVEGPEQGWTDEWVPDTTVFPDGSSVQHGPDKRFIEYTYPHLGATAQDVTNLDALIEAVGTYRPFLLDPAYDTEAARVVKFLRPPTRVVNTLVPNGGTPTVRYVLPMIDFLP